MNKFTAYLFPLASEILNSNEMIWFLISLGALLLTMNCIIALFSVLIHEFGVSLVYCPFYVITALIFGVTMSDNQSKDLTINLAKQPKE